MIYITQLHSKISSFLLNKTNQKFIDNGGLDRLKEEICDLLKDALPHGSGIDADWVFGCADMSKPIIVCNCSYHVMDNNGYYCGWVSFTVKFNIESFEFDVEVDQKDINAIYSDYETEEIENIDDPYRDDPSPYLDDLDDDIYSRVEYSLEQYIVREAIRFARQHYPDILKQEIKDLE